MVIDFYTNENVKQLSRRIRDSTKKIHHFDVLDKERVAFAKSTPMSYLLKDKEFLLRINRKYYTSVLNFTAAEEGYIGTFDGQVPINVFFFVI